MRPGAARRVSARYRARRHIPCRPPAPASAVALAARMPRSDGDARTSWQQALDLVLRDLQLILPDAQQLLEIPEEDPLEQAYNIQLQGKLYLRLKRQKDAAEAYSKAHAIYVAQVNRDDIDEVEKGSAYYNLACIRGLLGDTEGALQSIVAATEYDWALYEEAQQDDDLEALWEHPKFKSIQVRRVWGRIKHHHVGTAKKMRRSHWQQSLLDAAEDAVTAELDLSVDTAPSTREEYTERFD